MSGFHDGSGFFPCNGAGFACLVPPEEGPPVSGSEGPNAPGTTANDDAVGTVAWSDTDGAMANGEALVAVVSGGTGVEQSNYLLLTNFGFAIPAGATIDGIVASIDRDGNGQLIGAGAEIRDAVVKLVIGGVVTGNNKAITGSAWPTTETATEYGGVADLWGTTPTAEQINAAGFGIVVSVDFQDFVGQAMQALVDFTSLTVHYTEA